MTEAAQGTALVLSTYSLPGTVLSTLHLEFLGHAVLVHSCVPLPCCSLCLDLFFLSSISFLGVQVQLRGRSQEVCIPSSPMAPITLL